MVKNHKTKLVLFDLDGTLIDTAPDFLFTLNKILSNNGKEVVTKDEIKFHISEGTAKLIKTFFKIESDDINFNKYKNEFLTEYKSWRIPIRSRPVPTRSSPVPHLG